MYWGTCIERGSTQKILKFIRMGIGVNTPMGHSGEIPLHVCAKLDHLDAAHVLLMAGADPNLLDHVGYTSIQAGAHYNCSMDMLLLLLRFNADGYVKNSYGYSALDYARSYGTHVHIHAHFISKKWRKWTLDRIKSREHQFLRYIWNIKGISCNLEYFMEFLE